MKVFVEGFEKDYGKVKVLKGISFEIKEGEIFGFIGLNGVGKSIMFKIFVIFFCFIGGKVEVFGYDVVEEVEEVRVLISYLFEEVGVYKNLIGFEYFCFMVRFYVKDEKKVEEMVKCGV